MNILQMPTQSLFLNPIQGLGKFILVLFYSAIGCHNKWVEINCCLLYYDSVTIALFTLA